jgi:hypothetical protein
MMQRIHLHAAMLASVLLFASGCANRPAVTPPEVPATLRPPADQIVFAEGMATGVQIYECVTRPGEPSRFEWAFRAPEATLVDRAGALLAKHYAGPTWEAPDGSKVVGELKGHDAGPDPSAIPWLLLSANSTGVVGLFSPTKSVQRVGTVGGLAPADPCGPGNLKQIARIPYRATYYFYRAGA